MSLDLKNHEKRQTYDYKPSNNHIFCVKTFFLLKSSNVRSK